MNSKSEFASTFERFFIECVNGEYQDDLGRTKITRDIKKLTKLTFLWVFDLKKKKKNYGFKT